LIFASNKQNENYSNTSSFLHLLSGEVKMY